VWRDRRRRCQRAPSSFRAAVQRCARIRRDARDTRGASRGGSGSSPNGRGRPDEGRARGTVQREIVRRGRGRPSAVVANVGTAACHDVRRHADTCRGHSSLQLAWSCHGRDQSLTFGGRSFAPAAADRELLIRAYLKASDAMCRHYSRNQA
jgi:hypothetical protein